MMILWLVAKQRLVDLHNNIVATMDDRCIHKCCPLFTPRSPSMMILWLVAKQRLIDLHNNIVATKDDRCTHKFCRAHLAEPLVYLRGSTFRNLGFL